MQHLPTLEVAQRAIRQSVCTKCTDRPSGSEKLGPDEPRSCQGACTVFINLPKLMDVAKKVTATTLGPYENAVRTVVCEKCESSPTSGDFCAERTTRDCPLSRYMNVVVETLERLVK